MEDPPLAGWHQPHVMDGWGTRPLRWLSVLVPKLIFLWDIALHRFGVDRWEEMDKIVNPWNFWGLWVVSKFLSGSAENRAALWSRHYRRCGLSLLCHGPWSLAPPTGLPGGEPTGTPLQGAASWDWWALLLCDALSNATGEQSLRLCRCAWVSRLLPPPRAWRSRVQRRNWQVGLDVDFTQGRGLDASLTQEVLTWYKGG